MILPDMHRRQRPLWRTDRGRRSLPHAAACPRNAPPGPAPSRSRAVLLGGHIAHSPPNGPSLTITTKTRQTRFRPVLISKTSSDPEYECFLDSFVARSDNWWSFHGATFPRWAQRGSQGGRADGRMRGDPASTMPRSCRWIWTVPGAALSSTASMAKPKPHHSPPRAATRIAARSARGCTGVIMLGPTPALGPTRVGTSCRGVRSPA